MRMLARLIRYLTRRRKGRHGAWARKNRVLLAPDRAITTSVNGGWWLK